MSELDLTQVAFRKSTHSDATGCVEAAVLDRRHLVRDSKDPNGPVLAFTGQGWSAFLDDVKAGQLDL